ncbi:MAG: cell wall-active antibiotics response protein [Oscillospiraceae bacterium]|nr:cell wall-active antibiotics response protein [Oscillospiraceae bacterium]
MKNKRIRPSNVFWGIWFIAAAGVIVLHVFGHLGEVNVWSLLIGTPVAALAIASAVKMEWLSMFVQLGILVFIFRRPIEGLLDIRINFWALAGIVALLSIGFHTIFGKGKFAATISLDGTREYHDKEDADGEKLYFAGKFGGSSKYINSDNLSYVSVKNKFGGMEIYFENATLSTEGAVVEVENSFGGVELYIPRGWNIVDQMDSSFAGGVDIPKTSHTDGAPTITLHGTNSFGGIEVVLV